MSKSYVQRAFRAAGLSNNQPPTASYAIAASNSDDSEASASAFTSIGKAARAPTATFPVSADGPAPAPLGSSQPVAQGAHSLRGKIPTTAPFDVRHVATVRTQAVSTGGARRAEYSPSTPPPVAVGGGPSSRELTPPLKSSEVSGPNQARRQLLSPVNPLRHTDVAIFCTSCWSSPLTRTRTGRIPRCKQSNHPMTGAVTVVRWRSSDRHIWVPVRPPPRDVTVYQPCEHSRAELCPRGRGCPFSHSDPPDVEIAYWTLVRPLAPRKKDNMGDAFIPKMQGQYEKELRVLCSLQLQQDIMACLQAFGSRLFVDVMESILQPNLGAKLQRLKVMSLSEFLRTCPFAKLQGREVYLHVRERILHNVARGFMCCSLCWRASSTNDRRIIATTERDSQGGVKCSSCGLPWEPICVRRSRKSGNFFESDRIEQEKRQLVLCPLRHADGRGTHQCPMAHSQEELDHWRSELIVTQSGLVTSIDERLPYTGWCMLCESIIDKRRWEEHKVCELHLSKERVASSCDLGFRYRVPITGIRESYNTHLCFQPDGCKKGGLTCTHTHSEEEKLEWEERRRRKRLGIAGAEDQPLIKGVAQTNDALTCAAMLLLSVEESHLTIITLVIQQYPASLSMYDKDGTPLLCLAVNCVLKASETKVLRTLKVVKTLIDHGVPVNALDKEGRSPLHIAVMGDNLELTAMLIRAGVLLETATSEGLTALQVASNFENTAQVKLLLQHGAQNKLASAESAVSIYSSLSSPSPLALAGWHSQDDTSDMIKDYQSQAEEACKSNDHVALRDILQTNRFLANAEDHAGHSLLHLATVNKAHESMQVLLEFGASVFVTDKEGNTLVHVAAGNVDAFGMGLILKEDGSLIAIENKSGVKPFDRLLSAIKVKSPSATAKAAAIKVALDYDSNLTTLKRTVEQATSTAF